VIVTTTNLNAVSGEYGLETLRQHRESNGLRSVIVTVQEIYPVYPGRDNAEKLRNFLRDAYVTWGVRYVLLAGDTAYVPHRNLYLNSGADYFPADLYYAHLEGDFDANRNNRFGEIFAGDDSIATNRLDLTAEVAVGRFSGESAYEIQTAVYKTFAYEALPVNAGVHNRALIWTDIYAELGNRITSGTSTPGFSTDDPETNGSRLWNTAQDPVWKRMNSGQWGFFSHGGHGGPGGIAYFDEGSCNALANAPGFFHCTTIGCQTGKFDEHCLPEFMTTHNRSGGAFATVMNSNLGYAGPINAAVDYEFEIPFGSGVTEAGWIVALERERLALSSSDWFYMWTCYERNLFGDPAAKWRALYALGLGARYAFDGDVCDLSGNGAHGDPRNGPAFVPGRWGQALRFDGVNDYVACVTPHAFPAIQHELSLSAWVKPESLKDNMGILHKGDNIYQAYAFGLNADGRPFFKANRKTGGALESAEGTGVWTGAVAVAAGQWTHMAVTLKHDYEVKNTETNNVLPERETKATLTFYVNGVAGTPLTLDNLLLGRTREALCLGANMLNSERAYFHGTLDEMRVWSRDLTANEVKLDMHRGLAARYAFEGNANDSGPFAKNGTREGGTSFAADRGGQVLAFDGSSGQVRVSESATTDPLDVRRRLTLAAWVRPDSLRANAGLIAKGTNGAPFSLVLGADGRPALRINQGTGLAFASGGGAWTGSVAVAAGAWSHVAARYDGREVAFFINGKKDAQTARADLVFGRSNEPLFLGAAFAGGSGRFHGRLDEAQLFAFALEDDEIARLAFGEIAALASPAVELLPPSLATPTTATVEGRVAGATGGTATLYYGPADAGFVPGDWTLSASAAVGADGAFAIEATGLAANSRHVGRVSYESGATRGWSAETSVFGPYATLGWTRRLPLTLPMADAAFTNRLTDFPLLVALHEGLSGFRYAEFAAPGTGADLRFTDAAGALLDHEVDEWNTNGTSLVWVSVPALKPGTVVYAWWGKPGATAPSSASQSAVWQRAGAEGVWHLKESGTTAGATIYKDSSGKGRTGADYVAATGKAGKVGKGQQYAVGDGISYTASTAADNSFTVSFWCRPAAGRTALTESNSSIVDVAGQRFVINPFHGGPNAGVGLSVGTNGLTVIEHGGNYRPALYNLNTTLGTSVWTHVALVYDGKQPRLYLNGARQGNGGLQSVRPGWSRLGGNAGVNASNGFVGELDALTLQSGVQSEAWLKALYQNQNNPVSFQTFGAVAAVDGTTVTPLERTWDGGGADNAWSSPANWDGDAAAPAAGNALRFAGGQRLTPSNGFTSGTRFDGLAFSAGAGAFTLSGSAMQLGGDIVNDSSAKQTVNVNLTLLGDTAFHAGGGDLAVGGGISGAFGLTKSGSRTLTLSAANSYAGGTVLAGGVVQANHALALGSGGVTLSGGVRLGLGSGVTLSNAVTVNANAGASGYGLLHATAGTATLAGPLTLNAGAAAGGHFGSEPGAVLIVSDSVSSSVTPITFRTGTGVFSGGGSYTSFLATGTVRLGAHNGLGTNAVLTVAASAHNSVFDLGGYSQTLAGLAKGRDRGWVTNSGAASTLTLAVKAGDLCAYGDPVQGALAVVKRGRGTQSFAGTNSLQTLTVQEGTLELSAPGLWTTGVGGASVSVGGASAERATLRLSGAELRLEAVGNEFRVGEALGGQYTGQVFQAGGSLTSRGNIRLAASTNCAWAAYTLTGGSIALTNASGSYLLVGRDGVATFAQTGGSVAIQRNQTGETEGALMLGFQSPQASGTYTLDGGSFAATNGGSVLLGRYGTGALTLTNGAVAACHRLLLALYAGSTGMVRLAGSELRFNELRRGWAATPPATAAVFDWNGLLRPLSADAAVAASLQLTLVGAGASVDTRDAAGAARTMTLAGPVGERGGSFGFRKTGAGTLALTAANAYSGPTVVSNGTLLASNAAGSATGSGMVTVCSGATLGGAGTASGAVTVLAGGRLAPGVGAAPGTLACGGLTLAGGAALAIDCDASAADRAAVAGPLTVQGGGMVELTYSGARPPFRIVIATSSALAGREYLPAWRVYGVDTSVYQAVVTAEGESLVIRTARIGCVLRVL
jgi:autotransporter-associated beta strand protein